MTFSFESATLNKLKRSGKTESLIIIKNSIGQNIKSIVIEAKSSIKEDLSNQRAGLYIASWIIDGEIIESKRFLLIK